METTLSGRIWKFGDNVNTDDITPSSYLTITDPNELAKCAMENLNPEFAGGVKEGDIIVAGRNFGCGSSREHAPVSLKAAGVSLVVAQSFARIFYRNAINLGLPVLESQELVDAVEDGDEIQVDIGKGEITIASGKIIKTNPLPENILGILEAGGLINKVRRILEARQ
jgi:3-isopropylmalate/(R)-2-methylmalate dehydratase small subunit